MGLLGYFNETISIHALREEGDRRTISIPCGKSGFLSTPSARRATIRRVHACGGQFDFYPRPPRGGRLSVYHVGDVTRVISIHALREEGDQRPGGEMCFTLYFYPRPPRGGRRFTARAQPDFQDFYPRPPRGGRPDVPAVCPSIFTISIHALREEGDVFPRRFSAVIHDFYPRPPRGGRRDLADAFPQIMEFLSTPSARRATGACHTGSL